MGIASAFPWAQGTTDSHRVLSTRCVPTMLCLVLFLWDHSPDPNARVRFIPLNFLWSISTCPMFSPKGLGAQLSLTPASVIPRSPPPKPCSVFFWVLLASRINLPSGCGGRQPRCINPPRVSLGRFPACRRSRLHFHPQIETQAATCMNRRVCVKDKFSNLLSLSTLKISQILMMVSFVPESWSK